MAVSFQPDTCLPKDAAGWGMWLNGHYREHLQMGTLAASLASVNVPNYDILSWRDEPEIVQQWLVAHEQIHEALRVICNVTGTDLSLVDLKQDDDFLEWQDAHALEHQIFRQVLGIT